jgi:hypothetical protein
LLHFIFETLLSLFEKPAPNELQKEPPTIMSAGEGRNRRMWYAHVWGLEGIVCQRAIDPCPSDCICDH